MRLHLPALQHFGLAAALPRAVLHPPTCAQNLSATLTCALMSQQERCAGSGPESSQLNCATSWEQNSSIAVPAGGGVSVDGWVSGWVSGWAGSGFAGNRGRALLWSGPAHLPPGPISSGKASAQRGVAPLVMAEAQQPSCSALLARVPHSVPASPAAVPAASWSQYSS